MVVVDELRPLVFSDSRMRGFVHWNHRGTPRTYGKQELERLCERDRVQVPVCASSDSNWKLATRLIAKRWATREDHVAPARRPPDGQDSLQAWRLNEDLTRASPSGGLTAQNRRCHFYTPDHKGIRVLSTLLLVDNASSRFITAAAEIDRNARSEVGPV